MEAIAERPDGTRVNFIPYPTPLFDEDGALVGAVNMFIDITPMKQAQALRLQAIRCRRLALGVGDAQTSDTLNSKADEYEEKARAIGIEVIFALIATIGAGLYPTWRAAQVQPALQLKAE